MKGWTRTLALVCLVAAALAAPLLAAEGEKAAEPGPWLKTKYGVSLYGFFKLDLVYDDSRMNQGDYARWVEPEEGGSDNQSNITANQSRFGLKFDTEERHPVRTRGQVEVDLYGAAPENKPELMIRHAFLEVEWPESDVRLLAGQTFDVISPLNPPVINYTVNWWCGNIGYRRAQLRYTKGFHRDGKARYNVEVALARNIGHDAPFDPGDTGEDEAMPSVQGRFSFAIPMGPDRNGTFGFSGHVADEEWDYAATGESYHLDSSSLNFDFKISMSPKWGFQGEFFHGTNLDAYLGGIGNGLNVPAAGGAPAEIGATGGWLNVGGTPFPKWTMNFGAGVDDPDDADLTAGMRSRNRNVYGNFWYDLTPAAKVGFELSQWDTSYRSAKGADDWRFQGAFLFNF